MASKKPSALPVQRTEKKNGRPIKLDNATTRTRLIELIARGLPMKHACAAVRINYQTFCNYRAKHEWFREELEEALAAAIEKRLKVIEDATSKDWRAAAWLNEHLFPEHFAKSRLEITGANGGPLAAGIGIYLPKKDNGQEPVIEINPVNQIENESD